MGSFRVGGEKQNRPSIVDGRCALLVLCELALVRHGQLVPALPAARGHNRPSAPGGHPREEPMFPQARNALWLIRSLRHRDPRSAPENDASIPNRKPPLQAAILRNGQARSIRTLRHRVKRNSTEISPSPLQLRRTGGIGFVSSLPSIAVAPGVEITPAADDPLVARRAEITRELLREGIRGLSPLERDALRLATRERLSVPDAASQLGSIRMWSRPICDPGCSACANP